MDIQLPNLGEEADSGSVVSIQVKVGEKISKDQTILELENEKAVAPIPSPAEGVVEKIYVKIGDKISAGMPIISITVKDEKTGSTKPSGPEPIVSKQTDKPSGEEQFQPGAAGTLPPAASPTVRLVAEELGIDLTRIRGSAHGGRILMSDIKAYIDFLKRKAQPASRTEQTPPKTLPEKIDFSKWGPVRAVPLSPMRQTIGRKMTQAWTTIPQVTQFDETDVTGLLERRKQRATEYKEKGAHLTVTAVLVKCLAEALKKHPTFNASLDESSQQIILKDYYHIGIAVDTEAGLTVPVIKDADKKDLLEISKDLEALAQKARQRKLTSEELQGATITITNLGGLGGGFFAPIINTPQCAILGVGKAIERLVILEGSVQNRWMMPLSLAYDHRLLDGADGSRFMKDLVGLIEKAEI